MCCVVVCDLETSRMGAPYIYDISHIRVKITEILFYLSSPLKAMSAKMKVRKMINDIPYILALVTRIVRGRNIVVDLNIFYK